MRALICSLLVCPMMVVAGCSAASTKTDQPAMGALPTAVTGAEPEWIPFSIRAGERVPAHPSEQRFLELRQLTTDGTSSTPVWHPGGRHLLFETGASKSSCGQLRAIDLGDGKVRPMSPPSGWASSAAYRHEAGLLYVYAAHAKPPCRAAAHQMLWTLPSCDVVAVGGKPVISGPGYDGELAATRDGTRLVFTSTREGNPEVYVAAADGSGIRRVTKSPGYDGSASFSPDGSKLVWQAERLGPEAEAAQPSAPVAPASLHLMVAGAQGQNPRVVTKRGKFNITPVFLADSRRVMFASDRDSATGGTNFELYVMDPDGVITAAGTPPIERITFHEGFDGQPRISPDGTWLAFTSTRNAKVKGQTNIFVARIAE